VGGNGADQFIVAESAHSMIEAPDQIGDFQPGESDKLDLSMIDAEMNVVGEQAFAQLTSSATAFSTTTTFTAAAQLYFDQGAKVLYGNTDADAEAEFAIELVGVASLALEDLIL
jgi:Ca2+-binding RTX toxin-like protein